MKYLRTILIVMLIVLSASRNALAACDAIPLIAMQTEMMVTAISCRASAGYNTMVRRHRQAFAAAQRGLVALAGSQSAYDEWMTELANQRGLNRSKQGDAYCARAVPLLLTVSRAKTVPALRDIAVSMEIPYPRIGACIRDNP